jgi:hypothetical protein
VKLQGTTLKSIINKAANQKKSREFNKALMTSNHLILIDKKRMPYHTDWRLAIDKHHFSYDLHIPERRSRKDRRKGLYSHTKVESRPDLKTPNGQRT